MINGNARILVIRGKSQLLPTPCRTIAYDAGKDKKIASNDPPPAIIVELIIYLGRFVLPLYKTSK